MFTFFNQFDQPLVNTYATATSGAPATVAQLQELGILGIMVQTALLTGVVLYLLGRFTLPFGSITILVGLNGALQGSLAQNFDLIPVAIIGGLLADLVMLWLKPGPQRVEPQRSEEHTSELQSPYDLVCRLLLEKKKKKKKKKSTK